MEVLALIILVICSIVGFAAIFFTTFGTLIILVGAVVYALLTKFTILSVGSVVILLALYFLGEACEYISVIISVKKCGASNKAILGALLGGMLGAVVGVNFLGIGLVAGTFMGIFLGAFMVEMRNNKDLLKSFKAGAGGSIRKSWGYCC